MSSSLLARFVDAFGSGFGHKLSEYKSHALVAVASIIYWFFIEKTSSHIWEIAAALIWAILGVVIIQSFKAAHLLSRQITNEANAAHEISSILSQYGDPVALPKAEIPRHRARVYGIALILTAACLLLFYSVWEVAQFHSSTASQAESVAGLLPVAVFADCEWAFLPISVPPQTTIHLVALNRKVMLSRNSGLNDFTNFSDQQVQWPSKEKMNLSRPHNPGAVAYKCDFSNHSQANILDVAVPMRIWFGEKGGEENAIRHTPILSPLDAGSHFMFYVVNDCPVAPTIILPDSVTVTVVGEAARRSVALNRPRRSPIEPFMMFFPSATQWVGEQPCE